ncbi:hypothetical protein [Psychrobacillus sp. L4]|uniref:hypothetical protein n=1 Tax=Psychrobacillus sp. L4 TaxID=3236892 RepID=UPI0036F1B061
MKRGILVYDQREQEWRVWIGQTRYWVQQGYTFELRIQQRYFNAYLEKDIDWFVTLDYEVIFILHLNEVYKIRINTIEYIPLDTPF